MRPRPSRGRRRWSSVVIGAEINHSSARGVAWTGPSSSRAHRWQGRARRPRRRRRRGGGGPGAGRHFVLCAPASCSLLGSTPSPLPTAGAGQVCSATSRLLIQRPIYDAVVERVLEKMAAVVVGKPLDAATTMGPLVSREQQERVRVGAESVFDAPTPSPRLDPIVLLPRPRVHRSICCRSSASSSGRGRRPSTCASPLYPRLTVAVTSRRRPWS